MTPFCGNLTSHFTAFVYVFGARLYFQSLSNRIQLPILEQPKSRAPTKLYIGLIEQ